VKRRDCRGTVRSVMSRAKIVYRRIADLIKTLVFDTVEVYPEKQMVVSRDRNGRGGAVMDGKQCVPIL
jgi:hypothetical protein